MLHTKFVLSPRATLREAQGGMTLLCTHPLQIARLNAGAAALLQLVAQGGLAADLLQPEQRAYLEAMQADGPLRAEYTLTPPAEPIALEVIVPAYLSFDPTAPGSPTARLDACLAALATQSHPPECFRVTVVDDASPHPLARAVSTPPALEGRLRWLRLERNGGPGAARNHGVQTPWPDGHAAPLLAFVDADAEPGPHWLAHLAAMLEGGQFAAVAAATLPLQTRGLHKTTQQTGGLHTTTLQTRGLLGAYEGAASSLYLGPAPAPVGVRHGPPYLPSVNMGVMRAAFLAVGGFRPGWRVGEDVDLCWRIQAAGGALFYHPGLSGPSSGVRHAHRTALWPFLRRKFDYATSEAPLARTHPARTPRALPRLTGLWLLLVLATLLASGAWARSTLATLAALAALADLLAPVHAVRHLGLQSLRGMVPPSTLMLGLARGVAGRVLQTGRVLTRRGLPLLGGLALLPPLLALAAQGSRGILAGPFAQTAGAWGLSAWACAMLIVGTAGEWMARGRELPLWRFAPGYLLESLAYSPGWAWGWGRVWLRKGNGEHAAESRQPPPG